METGSAGIVAKATVYIQVTLAVEKIVKKEGHPVRFFILVLRTGLAGPERGHNFDTPRLISNLGYRFDRGGGGGVEFCSSNNF